MALLFYGALNLIHIRHAAAADVRLIVRIVNVLMLLYLVLAVVILGAKGNPQAVALVAIGVVTLGLSFST